MAKVAGRAVVVGAGMAGLLAARVLADHVEEVVVLERDELPSSVRPRRGVPQGAHVHALLARGLQVLKRHFPGFGAEVVARGGLRGDLGRDTTTFIRGGYALTFHSGLDLLFASRPLLEAVARERLRTLDAVRVLDRTDAVGLTAADGRVSGVRTRRAGDAPERHEPASIVVCATGRAAAPLAWLEQLGYPRPVEEEVRVDLTYVTRTYRRRPGDMAGARSFVVAADPPSRRSVGALAREGDQWTVTLAGYLGERPPTDVDGFRRFAGELPARELADLLAYAEPVGGAVVTHYPANRRRRFDRLRRLPEGFLAVGDAISSFNPIYGQGMTVAAEESVVLDEALAQGPAGLSQRFFAGSRRVVGTAWAMSAGGDLRFPEVVGRRPLQVRLANAYVTRLLVAAHRDPVVALAFFRATNFLDPPRSLLRPAVAARVLTRPRTCARSRCRPGRG